jgi:thiol-disulfide isomerase/thioredoxin
MIALLLAAVLAGELDAAALHKLIEARRGHPVVVNFWSTWCAPCVKEFPALVGLAGRHRDAAFVSVSLDDKEDRAAVESFVAKQQPPFPVYLKAAGPDEAFINGVDRSWSGVIPATLVLDREGRKVALLLGEHTPAEIERALEGVSP